MGRLGRRESCLGIQKRACARFWSRMGEKIVNRNSREAGDFLWIGQKIYGLHNKISRQAAGKG